jgi:hypothetical protein
MMDVFRSVGVREFDLTFTDIDGRKRGYRPAQQADDIRRLMRSGLIDSCVPRRTNIIVRPHPPSAMLLQLDDLDSVALARVSCVAFLVLATSPGNHQAWIALEDPDIGSDVPRRVKKAAGADPSASGATRIAGSINFKRKYDPHFPTVLITAAHSRRMVTAAELDRMGLIGQPERIAGRAGGIRNSTGVWPSYTRCVAAAPRAHNSDKPDISRADFTWCVIAADWGHSAEEIAARLLRLSPKADSNGAAYATLTAQRATAAVGARERQATQGKPWTKPPFPSPQVK